MAGKSFLEELGIDVGKVEKVETTGKPPVVDASQLIGPAQPNEKHPKSDQPARKAAAAKKAAEKAAAEKKKAQQKQGTKTNKNGNTNVKQEKTKTKTIKKIKPVKKKN